MGSDIVEFLESSDLDTRDSEDLDATTLVGKFDDCTDDI